TIEADSSAEPVGESARQHGEDHFRHCILRKPERIASATPAGTVARVAARSTISIGTRAAADTAASP
ncbi:MAG TPA: hypothetical protein VK524_26845, partial [Polyangiaceae bacterium]|nr:hypothetical protein [Polyangiaceae bacterium]